MVEDEVGDERAGAALERQVAVLAADHDDGQAGVDLPSALERSPHQAPVGSSATHGSRARRAPRR
jgi:hypothetical protein